VKISFLLLLLSLSLTTHAGERLEGISSSMEKKSANLFSKLFEDNVKNEDIYTTGKQQREEVTPEIKLEATRDPAKIKDGERHSDIKDNSDSFAPAQEKKSADTLSEIDIISDINAETESTIKQAHKRPTQVFINDGDSRQTTNENKAIHATNKSSALHASNEDKAIHATNKSSALHTSNENKAIQATKKSSALHASNKSNAIQTTDKDCVKEKVYSLDVDNASQYEHLEDFPFTYECVIRR
jgi:hypothetical protein